MNARQQKAEEIANGGKIVRGNGYWIVPSQSRKARNKVVVDGLFPSCTCEDFELREKDCKHIIAVRLFLEKTQGAGIPQEAPSQKPEPSPKVKRPTYKQDWPNYNAAQTTEKKHFQELLADLCGGIQEPPREPKRGRPKLALADAVFSACYKVYSTFSARRFMTDLSEAHRARDDIDVVRRKPGNPSADGCARAIESCTRVSLGVPGEENVIVR